MKARNGQRSSARILLDGTTRPGRTRKARQAPVKAAAGATVPGAEPNPDTIRADAVREAIDARQIAEVSAVQAILSGTGLPRSEKAAAMQAVLDGAAPDDVEMVSAALG